MVHEITAYRTSNDKVFNSKVQAYHEEILELYNRIPKPTKSYAMTALWALLQEVEGWVGRAKLLRTELNASPITTEDSGKSLSAALDRMCAHMQNWCKDAKEVHRQMVEEADPSVKSQLANM